MRKPDSLTFLSPCHNEENTLPELVSRCRAQSEALGFPFRMIVVDDGSTDNSARVLSDLVNSTPGLTALLLPTRMGKSAALTCGFAEINEGLIVTLDSDLQDQPEEVGKLLKEYEAGADLVSGWKIARHDPLMR